VLLRGIAVATAVAGIAVAAVVARIAVAAAVLAGVAIARGEHDLELVELVPLFFGALPFGYRLERLQPGARRTGLRFIHGPNYPTFEVAVTELRHGGSG
jgi:hypothetical protein